MAPRLAAQLEAPLLFAHRGASAEQPDNTLAAFRRAVELGTRDLESDLWVSADGVPMLAHDDNVGSLVRRQLISRSAAASLPDHVPSLAELFDAVGTDISLSIDIKDPAAIDATVDVLRRISDDTGTDVVSRTWLCDPSLARVTSWRARWSDIRLVHSTRLDRLDGGPERHASLLFDAGIDAVNFRAPDWTGGLTTLYHKFGVYCFGWDAHLTRVATELLDMGCDAIFSNHVDRMVEARLRVYGV